MLTRFDVPIAKTVVNYALVIPEGFFKTGISVLDHVKTGIPVFRRY